MLVTEKLLKSYFLKVFVITIRNIHSNNIEIKKVLKSTKLFSNVFIC